MFGHPTLESVSGDPQELGGFDDGARASERLLAQEMLSFAEIEIFQKNRHGPENSETELVGQPN